MDLTDDKEALSRLLLAGISGNAVKVWLALYLIRPALRRAEFFSGEVLSKNAGVSRYSFIKGKQELENAGLIKTEEKKTEIGAGRIEGTKYLLAGIDYPHENGIGDMDKYYRLQIPDVKRDI